MNQKLQEIYSGWKNLIWKNPEIEKIAKERAKICSVCPHITKIYTCGICSCVITAKVRNLNSNCPDKRWFKNDKSN